MKFHRQPAIGPFDVSLGRISRNSENFIRIGAEDVHRFLPELNVKFELAHVFFKVQFVLSGQ